MSRLSRRPGSYKARLLLDSLEHRITPTTFAAFHALANRVSAPPTNHSVDLRGGTLVTPVAGFTIQAGETMTVGADSHVNVADFRSSGTLTLAPGAGGMTVLTNTGASDMLFEAGSRTFVSDIAHAGSPAAAIDLNGHDAVVTGGLFVNNGLVMDSGPGGTHTIVAGQGALVKGSGSYQNTVLTQNGGLFQAGNSPGSAAFLRLHLSGPSGNTGLSDFLWQINDAGPDASGSPTFPAATGVAGPTANAANQVSGWSVLKSQTIVGQPGGDFSFDATPSDKFTIHLQTLSAPNDATGTPSPTGTYSTAGTDNTGLMAQFDPAKPYLWAVVKYTGTYTGPTDNAVLTSSTVFDATGGPFANSHPGTFSWSLNQVTKELDLVYAPSPPTIFTVTSTGDTGTGTGNSGDLRYVLTQATAHAGTDTIVFSNTTAGGATNFFDGTGHTINLLTPLPAVTDAVSIQGPGSGVLTVRRDPSAAAFRVFDLGGAAGQSFAISGMTVSGGSTTGAGTAGRGAGIRSVGETLTLTDVAVRQNSAASDGGGLSVEGGGNLSLTNSTVAGNSAATAGGAFVFNSVLRLTASTVSGNTAGTAAGLYLYGVDTAGSTIVNSTIANNTAAGTGGGLFDKTAAGTLSIFSSTVTGNSAVSGGGMALQSADVALHNVIVSGNQAATGPDIFGGTGGHVSTTYSAIGSASGFTYTPGTGDLAVGAALNLQPLANNGGPTQTVAFGSGSPLLNAGDPVATLTTDQRGLARVVGPRQDIGALEAQQAVATVASVRVNDGNIQRSEVKSLTVTFSTTVNFAGGNGNAAAAFTLSRIGGGAVGLAAAVTTVAGQTVVTLTFTGTAEIDPVSTQNPQNLTPPPLPSLADGRYHLSIADGAVTDATTGLALDGDGNGTAGGAYNSADDTAGSGPGYHLGLYRLFGDATGNGTVDLLDLSQLRSAFNSTGPGSPYVSYLDADNSNQIDLIDLGQFRLRFNVNLF